MKHYNSIRAHLISYIIGGSLLSACGGGSGGTSAPPPPPPPDTSAPTVVFSPTTLQVESTLTGTATITATDNVAVTSGPTVECTNGGSFSGSTFTAPSVTSETTSVCTATASDAAGNSGTGTLTVTITPPPDTIAPEVLFDPSTLTVESGQTAMSTVTATDNVGVTSGPDVACTNNGAFSGSIFTAPTVSAETTSVCIASVGDAAGNTGTATLTVTITPPASQAPIIETADLIEMEELNFDVVTFTGTDPEGDNLTWSKSGVDSAIFTLDPITGVLRFFGDPADFENPRDNNSDNIYNITVFVSDGENTISKDIAIEVTDSTLRAELKLTTSRSDLNIIPDVNEDGREDFIIWRDFTTPENNTNAEREVILSSDATLDTRQFDFLISKVPVAGRFFGQGLGGPADRVATHGQTKNDPEFIMSPNTVRDALFNPANPFLENNLPILRRVNYDPVTEATTLSPEVVFEGAWQTDSTVKAKQFGLADYDGNGQNEVLFQTYDDLENIGLFQTGDAYIVWDHAIDRVNGGIINVSTLQSDKRLTIKGLLPALGYNYGTTAQARPIGDMDGDGNPEIVFSRLSQEFVTVFTGKAIILSSTAIRENTTGVIDISQPVPGKVIHITSGEPTFNTLDRVFARYLDASTDVDGDGRVDLLIGNVDADIGLRATIIKADAIYSDADGEVRLTELAEEDMRQIMDFKPFARSNSSLPLLRLSTVGVAKFDLDNNGVADYKIGPLSGTREIDGRFVSTQICYIYMNRSPFDTPVLDVADPEQAPDLTIGQWAACGISSNSLHDWSGDGIVDFSNYSGAPILELYNRGIKKIYMADLLQQRLPRSSVAPEVSFNPPTLTVESGQTGTATLTAMDDVALNVTCTRGSFSGSTFTAPTVVTENSSICTATATDATGNTGTATLTVAITPPPDNIPPEVMFDPSTLTIESGGAIRVTLTATDNVRVTVGANVTCTNNGVFSGSTYRAPIVTVETISVCTATAGDAAGNITTATLTATIIPPPDITPPEVLFDPPTLTVESGQTATATLTATDAVGVTSGPDVACTNNGAFSDSNFTAPVVAVQTISICTATAEDAAGNTGTGTLTVTIVPPPDTIAPEVLFDPSTLTVESGQTAMSTVTATDNVGVTSGPDVACTNNGAFSGSTFTAPTVSAETTSVCVVSVGDAAGNTGTATLTVTITPPADASAPVVSFNPTTLTVESGQTAMSTVTATDNVGVTSGPDVSCTNNGTFSGSTFTAPTVTAETTSICTAKASNAAGNTGTATLTVTVTPLPNRAPIIETAGFVEMEELNFDVVTLAATDPDGDSITWSRSGVDASNFVLDPVTGQLRFFGEPADFENPKDLDENNTYNITIFANDGTNTTSKDISIEVVNTTLVSQLVLPDYHVFLPDINGDARSDILVWDAFDPADPGNSSALRRVYLSSDLPSHPDVSAPNLYDLPLAASFTGQNFYDRTIARTSPVGTNWDRPLISARGGRTGAGLEFLMTPDLRLDSLGPFYLEPLMIYLGPFLKDNRPVLSGLVYDPVLRTTSVSYDITFDGAWQTDPAIKARQFGLADFDGNGQNEAIFQTYVDLQDRDLFQTGDAYIVWDHAMDRVNGGTVDVTALPSDKRLTFTGMLQTFSFNYGELTKARAIGDMDGDGNSEIAFSRISQEFTTNFLGKIVIVSSTAIRENTTGEINISNPVPGKIVHITSGETELDTINQLFARAVDTTADINGDGQNDLFIKDVDENTGRRATILMSNAIFDDADGDVKISDMATEDKVELIDYRPFVRRSNLSLKLHDTRLNVFKFDLDGNGTDDFMVGPFEETEYVQDFPRSERKCFIYLNRSPFNSPTLSATDPEQAPDLSITLSSGARCDLSGEEGFDWSGDGIPDIGNFSGAPILELLNRGVKEVSLSDLLSREN